MKVANKTAKTGEDKAYKYLQDQGYKIIERNFRIGYGEIDIIATFQNCLIFIEVKTRTSDKFGTPFEAITFYKLKSLIKTAQLYKKLNPKLPDALRIDAVSVKLSQDNKVADIEHIKNITGY